MEPAYARIAATIRRQIESGDLQPGARLPSERELCDQWGVSSIVARQAIGVLRSDGLVRGMKGRGVYVAERPNLTRIVPDRYRRRRTERAYHEEAHRVGAEATVRAETVQTRASEDVAQRLDIDTSAMVSETSYRVTIGDVIVSHSTCWEPLDLTGGTEIEWPDEGPHANLGLVDRFAEIGERVQDVEEILTFRAASTRDLVIFTNLPPGVGVVAIAQTFRTNSRAVQVSDIVFRADRYRFIYRLPIPPGSPGSRGEPDPDPGEYDIAGFFSHKFPTP